MVRISFLFLSNASSFSVPLSFFPSIVAHSKRKLTIHANMLSPSKTVTMSTIHLVLLIYARSDIANKGGLAIVMVPSTVSKA